MIDCSRCLRCRIQAQEGVVAVAVAEEGEALAVMWTAVTAQAYPLVADFHKGTHLDFGFGSILIRAKGLLVVEI
jgi:hypothetical protein